MPYNFPFFLFPVQQQQTAHVASRHAGTNIWRHLLRGHFFYHYSCASSPGITYLIGACPDLRHLSDYDALQQRIKHGS